MTVKEFYEVIGGDYAGVMSRLMTEERVLKYLRKFVVSTEYSNMLSALDAKDYESAFRGSHSLKGMCANLGISELQSSSSDLCETMRPGVAPQVDISGLLAKVISDYEKTIDAINAID